MSKLKPKVELDAEMLKKIVSYYRINTADELWDDEEFLNWECFYHPSLELHECNTRALMPGRHKCKYCNHVVGKPCTVSCHLQNFCLALFAWRMGIGGETIEEALEYNLYQLEPEELYLKVIEKFSLGTNSETIELKSALNIDIP